MRSSISVEPNLYLRIFCKNFFMQYNYLVFWQLIFIYFCILFLNIHSGGCHFIVMLLLLVAFDFILLCILVRMSQTPFPCNGRDHLVSNGYLFVFRAPELLLGTKQYSTAIDMWSLGCIMAELLSKEPLFNGKTEFEQLDKVCINAILDL